MLTNTTISKQVEIDEFCHGKGIYFIAADVRGLFGQVQSSKRQALADVHHSSVFSDFGKNFACVDATGENPQSGMVVDIQEVSRPGVKRYDTAEEAQGEDATVTCLDETRHGLEDGDFVTFSEVRGMEGLNGCEPRKVSTQGTGLDAGRGSS